MQTPDMIIAAKHWLRESWWRVNIEVYDFVETLTMREAMMILAALVFIYWPK